ncbi:hypothetical protein ABIA68_002107 [Stenotrophomonas rhizophila]
MNPFVFVVPVLIVLSVKGLLAYVRFRKGRNL